jgi:DNA-binding LacI/PurR family transcriptional regulator
MQDSLKNLGVPYVYYGSDIPLGNAIEEFPSVTYHEKSILMSAVDHLVTKGHSSIAFMGSSLIEVDRNRCIQFVETLIQKGFSSPKIFMLQKEFDFDELLKLSRGPEVQEVSAIICSVDRLAIKLAQTLQSTGIKVPEEISIISVDNSFLCDFTYPPLTSIDLMNAQGIQRCVEYLACPKDRKIILQESFAPRVVERESVQELS